MTPEQERALAIARARKRKAEATGTTPQAILGTKATGVLQGAFGGNPAAPEPVRPVSRLESFDRGAQKGGAYGATDEAAGMRALTNAAPMAGPLGSIQNLGFGIAGLALEALPGQPPAAYTQGRDIQRSLESDAQRANPVTSAVGEIAGSVTLPVGGSARAATKTGQIAKGVGVGAATGGAYSFASEDGSLQDRAQAGVMGAGLGGAFGGILSAVIPRDIPLGDVLNAEIFGAKVERPVLKTIERLLVQSGVSPNDIGPGIVQLRQRLQGGDVGAGLPTRFKDELVNQFGEKARGVSKAIENQIRGGAVRSGSASDAAVARAVSEDNAAGRELFSRSVDQFAGSTSRPELRGQAIGQLEDIVETKYKPILAQPIADPAKRQALLGVLAQPRMQSLAKELAEDAEREGIDLAGLMTRNPAEAAHWMQSKARQLADDKGKVSLTGRVIPDRTMSNRRADILTALEDAVPGYRETRMEYGDKFGVTQAINFARGFLTRAKDDVAVADMAEEFAGLSEAQKQMALASLRSVVTGSAENVRYVDPELGTGALRTAEIGKEPVLKALSDVFGEQGTKLADDIKAIVSRTDANRRINPQATGSDSLPKAEAIKFAVNNTRGPIQRALGNVFGGAPMDLLGSAVVGGPTPISAARVGLEGAGKVADNRAMSTVDKVTQLLLSTPQNAFARTAPTPGAPPSGGGQIIDQLTQADPQNAFAQPTQGGPKGGKLGTRAADATAIATLAAGGPTAGADTGETSPELKTANERVVGIEAQISKLDNETIPTLEEQIRLLQDYKADPKEKQRILIARGHDLGTFGPNKDGVDGDLRRGSYSAKAVISEVAKIEADIARRRKEREAYTGELATARGEVNKIKVSEAEEGGKPATPLRDKVLEFGSYGAGIYLAHRFRNAGLNAAQKNATAIESKANALLSRRPPVPPVPDRTALGGIPLVGQPIEKALFPNKVARNTSATNAAVRAAQAAEPRLSGNAVPPISPNPTSPDGLTTRVANLNKYYLDGGAERQLPVEDLGNGQFAMRSDVMPDHRLYGPKGPIGRFAEPLTSRFRTGDVAVTAGGAVDYTVMSGMVEQTRADIKTAEEELTAARAANGGLGDATRINVAKKDIEKLETIESVQVGFQRLGLGIMGFGLLGGMHGKYARPQPRHEAAIRERNLIAQAISPIPTAPPPAPVVPPPSATVNAFASPPPKKPRTVGKPKPKPPVSFNGGRSRKAENDNDR